MGRIQVALDNAGYRNALSGRLRACQPDEVSLVDRPDWSEQGVVVVDPSHLPCQGLTIGHPDRVVLIVHPGGVDSPDAIGLAWNAGVHAVVYDKDPLDTAVLAILSARLRAARHLRKGGA